MSTIVKMSVLLDVVLLFEEFMEYMGIYLIIICSIRLVLYIRRQMRFHLYMFNHHQYSKYRTSE